MRLGCVVLSLPLIAVILFLFEVFLGPLSWAADVIRVDRFRAELPTAMARWQLYGYVTQYVYGCKYYPSCPGYMDCGRSTSFSNYRPIVIPNSETP